MAEFTPHPVTSESNAYAPRRAAPRPSSLPMLVGVLIVLGVVWLLPRWVENLQYAATRGRERAEVETARKELAENPADAFVLAFEQVAKSIGPSVVHINTIKAVGSRQDEWADFFGGRGRQGYAEEQGSGVIVDSAGYILTNNHVVDDAQELTVSLSDGRKVDAEIVGVDPPTDLAVIKINADGLISAPWGDSNKLNVGAPVWAVGNPYGLDRSVTFGIVSAKSRRGFGASPYQDFLQTDAAVNPGNSGGPLVNVEGQVVGINTAIIGKAYQGISFAIPSDMAHEVYEQLRSKQHVVRGYLGVRLENEITPNMAKKLGLKNTQGALVADVVPGGPADKAGIEPGDVIVEWNGQSVDTPTTLRLLIARTQVGSDAKATVIHDGERESKRIRITELPNRPQLRPR